MLSMKKASLLLVGVTAFGCTDTKSATAPQRWSPASAVSSDKNASNDGHDRSSVAARVNGDILFSPTTGLGELIAEHAVKHVNGAVDGEFQIAGTVSGTDYRMSGPVACFTVAGNTVRVAGLVAHSTTSDVPPGRYVIWNQQDNDIPKGKAEANGHQPADLSSHFYVVFSQADAEWHCDVGINVNTMFPATRGKVELYPEGH